MDSLLPVQRQIQKRGIFMKGKRLMALAAVIFLILLYILSIFFALMKHPLAENLLLASLFCTVVVPAILYGYAVAVRYFRKK